jgi:hypothetical protein
MLVAQDHFENIWVIPMTDILRDILHELTVVDVCLPTSRQLLLAMRAKQSSKSPQFVKQQKAGPEHGDQVSSSSVVRMPEVRVFDSMQALEEKWKAEARPSESKKEAPSAPPKRDESAPQPQFVFVYEPVKTFPTPRQKLEGKLDDISKDERRARILETELAGQEFLENEARARRARKAVEPQQGIVRQSTHRVTDAESLEERPRRSHKTEKTKIKETGKEKLTRMVREHAALQRELGIRRLSDLSQADTLINTRTPSEGSSGQPSRPNTARLSWADSLLLPFDSGDEEDAEEAREERMDSRVGLEPEAQAYISTPSNIRTPQMMMTARRQRHEVKEQQQKRTEASVTMTARQQETISEPPLTLPPERQIHVSSADSLYNQFRDELGMQKRADQEQRPYRHTSYDPTKYY